MKITWLGHACFLIECAGKRIITDPFDEHVGYACPAAAADIVTISHAHRDHNAAGWVRGNPRIISQTGEHKENGVVIKGIASFHDKNKGKNRGSNIIFKISGEGLNVVHLGDLGHILEKEQLMALGPVDILMLPVGGNYTLDAEDAWQVYQQIKPGVVIPMHFKTPVCTIDISPAESFLSKFDKIIKKPFLEIDAQGRLAENRVMVLDYLS